MYVQHTIHGNYNNNMLEYMLRTHECRLIYFIHMLNCLEVSEGNEGGPVVFYVIACSFNRFINWGSNLV